MHYALEKGAFGACRFLNPLILGKNISAHHYTHILIYLFMAKKSSFSGLLSQQIFDNILNLLKFYPQVQQGEVKSFLSKVLTCPT